MLVDNGYENSSGSSLMKPPLYRKMDRRRSASFGDSINPTTPRTPGPFNRIDNCNSTLLKKGPEGTIVKRISFKRCNTIGGAASASTAMDDLDDRVMLAPMIDFTKTPNKSPSAHQKSQTSSISEDKSRDMDPDEALNKHTPTIGLRGAITKSHSFTRSRSFVSSEGGGEGNNMKDLMMDLSDIDESCRSGGDRGCKQKKRMQRCKSLQTGLMNDNSLLRLEDPSAVTGLTRLQKSRIAPSKRDVARNDSKGSKDKETNFTTHGSKAIRKNSSKGGVGKGSMGADSGHSNGTRSSRGSRSSGNGGVVVRKNSFKKLKGEDDVDFSYQNTASTRKKRSSLKTALDGGSGHSNTEESSNPNKGGGGGGRRKNKGNAVSPKNLTDAAKCHSTSSGKSQPNNDKDHSAVVVSRRLSKRNLNSLESNSDHQPSATTKRYFERTLSRSSSDGDLSLVLNNSFDVDDDDSLQGAAARNGSDNNNKNRRTAKTVKRNNGSDKAEQRHTITSINSQQTRSKSPGSSSRHHHPGSKEEPLLLTPAKDYPPSASGSKSSSSRKSSTTSNHNRSHHHSSSHNREEKSRRSSRTTSTTSNHNRSNHHSSSHNREEKSRRSSRTKRLSFSLSSKDMEEEAASQPKTTTMAYKDDVMEASLMTAASDSNNSCYSSSSSYNHELLQLLSTIVTATATATTKTCACDCGYELELCCKFCGMCGAPQHWSCSDCGFDRNRSSFRFCGGCGVPKDQALAHSSSSCSDRGTPRHRNKQPVIASPTSVARIGNLDDDDDDERSFDDDDDESTTEVVVRAKTKTTTTRSTASNFQRSRTR